MMLATIHCWSWILKKPSVLQELDAKEVTSIAGKVIQAEGARCHMLQRPDEWMEHTKIRKENSSYNVSSLSSPDKV